MSLAGVSLSLRIDSRQLSSESVGRSLLYDGKESIEECRSAVINPIGTAQGINSTKYKVLNIII